MDEQLNLHIGQRLRARRRALGLSQSDLGAMTQVRFRQIHKYECGQNRTSASVLWKFACALGVSVQHFFEGWGEQPSTVSVQPVEIAANEGAGLAIYAADAAAGREEQYRRSAR